MNSYPDGAGVRDAAPQAGPASRIGVSAAPPARHPILAHGRPGTGRRATMDGGRQ
ncbi:hypothetical protein [Acidiphilium cryptum]|uniref:hypothetical protein n=1 Tax=Acidiphilium cryptum TaxID=524 RepID=UPI0012DC5E0C|nr:hypothetical protein [Acidiphilium cryptum]